MAEKHMLAADFGGSSGRVVKGNFDGNQISLEEIHRFANEPVTFVGQRDFHDVLGFPQIVL